MDHKQLDVWKVSMELVTLIYKITNTFPKTEQYGLTNQIRRSVVSIPSNIAEGSGRNGWKELHQFLGYSIGSAAELDTQILIAKNLNYIDAKSVELVLEKIEKVRKLLSGYKKYVRTKF